MSRRQSLTTSTVVKLCHGAAPVLVVGSPFKRTSETTCCRFSELRTWLLSVWARPGATMYWPALPTSAWSVLRTCFRTLTSLDAALSGRVGQRRTSEHSSSRVACVASHCQGPPTPLGMPMVSLDCFGGARAAADMWRGSTGGRWGRAPRDVQPDYIRVRGGVERTNQILSDRVARLWTCACGRRWAVFFAAQFVLATRGPPAAEEGRPAVDAPPPPPGRPPADASPPPTSLSTSSNADPPPSKAPHLRGHLRERRVQAPNGLRRRNGGAVGQCANFQRSQRRGGGEPRDRVEERNIQRLNAPDAHRRKGGDRRRRGHLPQHPADERGRRWQWRGRRGGAALKNVDTQGGQRRRYGPWRRNGGAVGWRGEAEGEGVQLWQGRQAADQVRPDPRQR